MKRYIALTILLTFCLGFSWHTLGAVDTESSTPARQPCNNFDELRQPYFGDLHIHTVLSLDANTQDTRTTPADAYRFARGGTIPVQPYSADGTALRHLQLQRPLDFAAVTDHAELFGELTICQDPSLEGYNAWQCKLYRNWKRGAFFFFNATSGMLKKHQGYCGKDNALCSEAAKTPWRLTREAAEDAYDKSSDCRFTSFVAYEWTGMTENAANMHRNVIFRNAQVPELPVNSIDYPTDHTLWDGLDKECINAGTGCDVLAIPHNSNLSGGFMFDGLDDGRSPYSAKQAAQRARLEPLIEVMQHKGSSECYAGKDGLGAGVTPDPLCAFEKLPKSTMTSGFMGGTPNADTGYVRQILREGQKIEQAVGVNPYKLGFIASSDTHISAPGYTDEDNFVGHGGGGGDLSVAGIPDKPEYNPGGLAVIYAEQNNRESLFAGLRRKETYGTSGPRIQLRFFGGWDYPEDLCQSPDLVKTAYAGGVPMGSDLAASQTASGDSRKAPSFVVKALKDPGTLAQAGTDLQHVQIIKGWVNAKGEHNEQRYEVAGNTENGAGVDINNCQPSGQGAKSLCSVWTDPDFDADQHAWYYARVLENPTCRWTQHICVANKISCDDPAGPPKGFESCCAADHQPVIQERAWSSPIWYTPKKS
jgi:hypothetical protein